MISKTISQKIKDFKEEYSICPNCGELSTFSQQLYACSNGEMPYCYCEFGGERGRIFIGYKRINKKLWNELSSLKNNKLRLKEYTKHKTSKIKRRKTKI